MSTLSTDPEDCTVYDAVWLVFDYIGDNYARTVNFIPLTPYS